MMWVRQGRAGKPDGGLVGAPHTQPEELVALESALGPAVPASSPDWPAWQYSSEVSTGERTAGKWRVTTSGGGFLAKGLPARFDSRGSRWPHR